MLLIRPMIHSNAGGQRVFSPPPFSGQSKLGQGYLTFLVSNSNAWIWTINRIDWDTSHRDKWKTLRHPIETRANSKGKSTYFPLAQQQACLCSISFLSINLSLPFSDVLFRNWWCIMDVFSPLSIVSQFPFFFSRWNPNSGGQTFSYIHGFESKW